MDIVLLFGSFDPLHPGHIWLIKQAQKYGQTHAVLALDETIAAYKQRPLFKSFSERAKELEDLGVMVHAGSTSDKLEGFKSLRPSTVVLGYDQEFFVDVLLNYIKEQHLDTTIVRVKSFKPELFKSSKLRPILTDRESGFLLIDKPSGEASLRTVTALRRLTGIKRIGFAGTLDPLASGLLVCGLSRACAMLDWWHLLPKTYEVSGRFGQVSDTYDSTGQVKDFFQRAVTLEDLQKTLKQFMGVFEQEAPAYSAKKVAGVAMYRLARQGKDIARKKQSVEVTNLELLKYHYPEVSLRLTVSAGTYIRSIIHDLGQKLEVGAVVTALRRTAIGDYSVGLAMKTAELTTGNYQQQMLMADEFRCQLNRYLWQEGRQA